MRQYSWSNNARFALNSAFDRMDVERLRQTLLRAPGGIFPRSMATGGANATCETLHIHAEGRVPHRAFFKGSSPTTWLPKVQGQDVGHLGGMCLILRHPALLQIHFRSLVSPLRTFSKIGLDGSRRPLHVLLSTLLLRPRRIAT